MAKFTGFPQIDKLLNQLNEEYGTPEEPVVFQSLEDLPPDRYTQLCMCGREPCGKHNGEPECEVCKEIREGWEARHVRD